MLSISFGLHRGTSNRAHWAVCLRLCVRRCIFNSVRVCERARMCVRVLWVNKILVASVLDFWLYWWQKRKFQKLFILFLLVNFHRWATMLSDLYSKLCEMFQWIQKWNSIESDSHQRKLNGRWLYTDSPLISHVINASKMRIVIAFYFEGHPANIKKP